MAGKKDIIETALKTARSLVKPAEETSDVGSLLSAMSAEEAAGRAAPPITQAASTATAAPASPTVRSALRAARPEYGTQTVLDPQRNAFPGIYENPREIAEKASKRVAPESSALRDLFNVTRQDLYDIGGTRQGNILPSINYGRLKSGAPSNPPETVQNIMIPENAQRLQDILYEAGQFPGLKLGMDAWYVMDPAYQRLVELFGREEAGRRYEQLNKMLGMSSPGSDVLTEMNRGTAANAMVNRDLFDVYQAYGGMTQAEKARMLAQPGSNLGSFAELLDIKGHPYHSTSQTGPMSNYLRSGLVNMTSPKVPLYIQSSGVPETGFQTMWPVADAHFTRGVGLADTRTAKGFGPSMNMAEYGAHFGPWFYENVARPIGMESVPAQARLWGGLSHITGVESPIGAPKLELLAQSIYEDAMRRGIDPRLLRDRVLSGEDFIRAPYKPKVRGKRMYGGPAELAPYAAAMYLGGRAKTPAWQRAEGKNPEGGLNAKGRASYNRENPDKPGLKRPQPEGGARRDSFCARMEGMKKKLTSKETANDPNSRINKSLRAWKC